jgi:hypothetical protein
VVAGKRVVRLTFGQTIRSIRVLLGDAIADTITADTELGDPRDRYFPPLDSAREGVLVSDHVLNQSDHIAQKAALHVLDNFAEVTGCGDDPSDDCGRRFVGDFAGRAYRRPLSGEETSSLLQVYTEAKDLLGNVKEAAQHAVYATLVSPQFLYRTELGGDANRAGPLSPYETASQLSFFLTDAPPDQPLLDAAAAGSLATQAEVTAQVTRLLGTDLARRNIEGAMMSYFALTNLESVIVDSSRLPLWSPVLRDAMYRESELFFRNTLWSGNLTDLLTSRRSSINATLAALYAVPFPPAGATLDGDGFAAVELPPTRAGILTQPGLLTTRARPNGTSVVSRGLLVNATILCASPPVFPEHLPPPNMQVQPPSAELTEKEKAAYRATQQPCRACHSQIDPFGLALENYDAIGGYRTLDDRGRTIDASVVLPDKGGGVAVNGAVEMAHHLASGDGFASCMATSFLKYALAEYPQPPLGVESCATRAIVDAHNAAGDKSFAALLRAVAISRTLGERAAGGGP